jgi:formylglycine-generating enzyme required for sulfatase activity
MNSNSDNPHPKFSENDPWDIDAAVTSPGSGRHSNSKNEQKVPDTNRLGHDENYDIEGVTGERPPSQGVLLKEGVLFANRYRILNNVGVGGMGEVYRVEDTIDGSEMALKRIRSEIDFREDVRKRFIREARVCQRITSWNVVRVHDVNQYGATLFYTMEYLQGATLRARLDKMKESCERMPLQEVRNLVKAVCRGLKDAHRLTVHRDLKPENIFICVNGDVKILDFGLAHALHGSRYTQHLQRMGTPYYMAPEQWDPSRDRESDIDQRADIYSLGVILYELLTLSLPTGFELISEERDDVAKEIDDFVRRCLSRRPENRPASAAEFFNELNMVLVTKRDTQGKGDGNNLNHQEKEAANRRQSEENKICAIRSKAISHADQGRFDESLELLRKLRDLYPSRTDISDAMLTVMEKKLEQTQYRPRQSSEPITIPQPVVSSTSYDNLKILDIGKGVKLEMIFLKNGTFQMGSPESEKDRNENEGPVHTVELDGFWMGKYPVTQAQYQAIMGTNPSHFKGDNRPIENVSWNDSMEFCRKLSQRTRKTFTLPTEAQWEYACRAGTTTRYYFGDDEGRLGEYAWYWRNSGDKPLSGDWDWNTIQEKNGRTHPVGQKKPNAWGLYDMHGNVYEWCLDWYGSYTSGTKRNPVGPGSGSFRVLRGGCWHSNAGLCRSAFRGGFTPSRTYSILGFRLVSTDSS